jgi:hypothetical protein
MGELQWDCPAQFLRSHGSGISQVTVHTGTTLHFGAQVMMQRLRPGTDATLLQNTEENLHAFSVKGLRTLIVGARVCFQLPACLCKRISCRSWLAADLPASIS